MNIFDNLSSEEKEILFDTVSPVIRTYHKGDTIFYEGDEWGEMYFITDGEYELSVKIVYIYYDLLVDYLNKIGLSNKCESEFLLNCLERVLQERSSIVISNSYVEETRDIKDAITPEIDIRDQYDFALEDYYGEEKEWNLDHEREEAESKRKNKPSIRRCPEIYPLECSVQQNGRIYHEGA